MDLERSVALKRETRWHEKFQTDRDGKKVKYQARFHSFDFRIANEKGHAVLRARGRATVEKIHLKHFPQPFERLPLSWQEKVLWSFDSGNEWLLYDSLPCSYKETLIHYALRNDLLLDNDELTTLFTPVEQQFDAICRQASYELIGIRSVSRAA